MKLTINNALAIQKTIKSRLSDLVSLRAQVSTKDIYMTESNKVVEPQYDVKKVDAKVVRLQQILFNIDSCIKQSNAVVEIDINFSEEEIFEPLA